MITLDTIRAHLRATNEFHGGRSDYALPLVDAIEAEAGRSEHYAATLELWLRDGGTLVLRDQLCPFVYSDEIIDLARRKGFAYPWSQCWTALDTARHNARFRPL